ncbi:MAG TPA: hypothetical protein VGD29_33980 [Actinoplanes sp.]
MTSSPSALSSPLATDPYGIHVTARLLDFFADTSPWPRRLWEVSSVLALREAYEAGKWQAQQVLGSTSVTWYLRALERQLGPDRGLGDGKLRKHLIGLLRSNLAPESPERRQLHQLLPMLVNGYLDRWRDRVAQGAPPSPERIARAVATHLLDLGHSTGQLHRWARELADRPGATLDDLLDSACDLARRPDVGYEVIVPFTSVPKYQTLAAHLPQWRPAKGTAEWFASNGVANPPRQYGAFVFDVVAKDPAAAARVAGSLVQKLQARATYARGSLGDRLAPVGQVWVKGHPDPLPLTPPARGVDVLSLVREKTLYSLPSPGSIDDALEMAAPLNSGAPAPAVSGGWSAIESLLSRAADTGDGRPGRVVAADRLAAIVACSWPRAELTPLSWRHSPAAPDRLGADLERLRIKTPEQNLNRCRVLAKALSSGSGMATSNPSDAAAAERMVRLLSHPYGELGDVRNVFQGTLRRLYRQRNIVVHGGTTASVAIEATLRTAGPLVGVGLDRIVHANLQHKIGPLELAARAVNSLELVGDDLGPEVVSLLE